MSLQGGPTTNGNRSIVYVLSIDQESELRVLQKRFPDGDLKTLRWPISEQRLMFVYQID